MKFLSDQSGSTFPYVFDSSSTHSLKEISGSWGILCPCSDIHSLDKTHTPSAAEVFSRLVPKSHSLRTSLA